VTFRNACGALALGDKGACGSAWGMSQHEAAAKALGECRPHGGDSCKIKRQVCSGAGR
jgi:serine/threonine-protein kinase